MSGYHTGVTGVQNQKWLVNVEVKAWHKALTVVSNSGDLKYYQRTRTAMGSDKRQYRNRVGSRYNDYKFRNMLSRLRTITDYKKPTNTADFISTKWGEHLFVWEQWWRAHHQCSQLCVNTFSKCVLQNWSCLSSSVSTIKSILKKSQINWLTN